MPKKSSTARPTSAARNTRTQCGGLVKGTRVWAHLLHHGGWHRATVVGRTADGWDLIRYEDGFKARGGFAPFNPEWGAPPFSLLMVLHKFEAEPLTHVF